VFQSLDKIPDTEEVVAEVQEYGGGKIGCV
jgi:hypothetical protein